jgi:hypothetical protein
MKLTTMQLIQLFEILTIQQIHSLLRQLELQFQNNIHIYANTFLNKEELAAYLSYMVSQEQNPFYYMLVGQTIELIYT